MKTVDIKGKKYVEVNERIKHFRANYPGWSLTSEIINDSDGKATIKATILDENGTIRATGHAYEKEGSSFINKTSYIENCETSAWGRALGNIGIGIDASVASAEEVGNAVKQQSEPPKPKPTPDADILKPSSKDAMNIVSAAFTKLIFKHDDWLKDQDGKYELNEDKLIKAIMDWKHKLPTSKSHIQAIVDHFDNPEEIAVRLEI